MASLVSSPAFLRSEISRLARLASACRTFGVLQRLPPLGVEGVVGGDVHAFALVGDRGHHEILMVTQEFTIEHPRSLRWHTYAPADAVAFGRRDC